MTAFVPRRRDYDRPSNSQRERSCAYNRKSDSGGGFEPATLRGMRPTARLARWLMGHYEGLPT